MIAYVLMMKVKKNINMFWESLRRTKVWLCFLMLVFLFSLCFSWTKMTSERKWGVWWGSPTLASHTAKRSMRFWTNWPPWWISAQTWNHLIQPPFILCDCLHWTVLSEWSRAAYQARWQPSHQEANVCCTCWHWYHRRHLFHGGTKSSL